MEWRTFGLRNEYSVVFSGAGQRQPSPGEVERLFGPIVSGGPSRNGGRLHWGAPGRLEYATPECGDVPDLVVHDKAGERILEGLAADAGRRRREEGAGGDIHVFKATVGPAAGSSGCQEDYLVSRRVSFGRLAGILIPFLVTRQLICGSGAVARTPHGAVFRLSRRAGRSERGLSPAAVRSRPFISTRDEPRAEGLRLRVIVSDASMSETTTLLKAGATDLVLRMAEAGTALPDLTLDNPVLAIDEVSRDITGRHVLRLADRRGISALDIQREYLTMARDFTGNRGADRVSRRVLGLWERALEAIGTGNLGAIAREIDWVTKFQLIEQYRADHALPLSAPQIAQADLGYHDIRRGRGLYYELQRGNAVDRTARDIDIFEAKTVPPLLGRYRQAG